MFRKDGGKGYERRLKKQMTEENIKYQELMRQTLAGDTRAYETLLKESARLLRPFLARYLKGNSEADDVLQEILISLHRAKHTYDGTRPYKPFLFAIAKFRLKDYMRRYYGNKLRHAIDIADIEEILPNPVTESDVSHELLTEGLHQLPKKQAEIVRLMHIEGYTAKEIGAKLGMNESAVKVAAHRAYKKLRAVMDKP